MKVSKKKYKEGGKVGPTDPRKKYSQHPADIAPNSSDKPAFKIGLPPRYRDNPTEGEVRAYAIQARREAKKHGKKIREAEPLSAEMHNQANSTEYFYKQARRAELLADKIAAEKQKRSGETYAKGGKIKVKKKC